MIIVQLFHTLTEENKNLVVTIRMKKQDTEFIEAVKKQVNKKRVNRKSRKRI